MTDAGGTTGGDLPDPEAFPAPPAGGIPKAPPVMGLPVDGSPDAALAGYGLRLVGYLLDGVIVLLAVGVLYIVGAGVNSTLFSVSGALVGLLYAALLIGGWNGQTVGMRAMGIRCVNAADGSPVTYGTSFLRAFIHAVFEIIPLVVLLDLLWPAWDKRNQTIHDKVASTIVVKA